MTGADSDWTSLFGAGNGVEGALGIHLLVADRAVPLGPVISLYAP